MATQILVEELTLKSVTGDGPNPPTAYCVVIDGKRSPLYFNRRDAEQAVANVLQAEQHE